MSGDTEVNVPDKSAEEKELIALQTQQLKRDQRMEELLIPIMYKNNGLDPILNTKDPTSGQLKDPSLPEGSIIGFEEQAPDPNEALREEIETGLLERSKAALAGELPLDPNLVSSFEKGEDVLRESLRKQLGGGFETSTPGIQALAEFKKAKEGTFAGARRGDLTMAESLSLARGAAGEDVANSEMSRIMSILRPGSGMAIADSLLNRFSNDRAMTMQADIAGANARSQTMGALFGAAGNVAGAYTLNKFL